MFRKGFAAPLVVIFALAVFLLVILLKKNDNLHFLTKQTDYKSTEILKKTGCLQQGITPNDQIFPKYIVKKGDTLLSVSKSQLNSTGRVTELINLNKSKYPEISLSKPFLEVGWELLLPPSNIVSSTGNLLIENGEIIKKDSSYWDLKRQEVTSRLYINEKTKSLDKDMSLYNVGDCIRAIIDNQSHQTYTISSN